MTNLDPTCWHTARGLLHGAALTALLACGGSVEPGSTGDDDTAAPALTHSGDAPLELASASAAVPAPASVEPAAPSSSSIEPVSPPPNEPDPATVPPAIPSYSCPELPDSSWTADEWVPFVSSSPEEALAAVRAAMVGSWHGLATTPWTKPYEVDLRFHADGSYSSRCSSLSDHGCCVAFYYGTDADTSLKQWRIEDATLSGNVFGDIDIAFDYFQDGYGLPAWQGKLSHIERDASGNGLRFEFQTDRGYGPVKYELRRSE